MNINPINYTSNSQPQTFQGRLIRKGFGWTPFLRATFDSSPELKKLSNGYDIVGRMSKKKMLLLSDDNIRCNINTYKLKLSFIKENSILGRIKDFLGLNKRYSLTHNYHSETDLADSFDKAHIENITSKLKK